MPEIAEDRPDAAGADGAEVEALLDGVVAAPPPVEPAKSMRLLMPAATAGEVAGLVRRATRLREARTGGLGESPAPPARLDALRAELARRGLAGFVVPLADEHQGEFVAPRARRLAWLTGFTGSAGIAVIMSQKAAIFVDGRYTLQVEHQVDTKRFEPRHVTEQPPAEWIADNLGKGAALGYDPWLHTLEGVGRLRAACERAGGRLVPVEGNPVDAVWPDQPAPPLSPAVPQPLEYAGIASAAKRQAIADALARRGVDAAALSAPDSIAWLLNMRGADVPNTPLALSFAIVGADGAVSLFIDPRKVTRALAETFGNGVAVAPPDAFGPALDTLAAAGKRVQIDPHTAPAWIAQRLEAAGAPPVRGDDPCTLPKACKNETELAGARAAHVRDGRALVRFLAWLAEAAPRGGVTEMAAAERLLAFRADDPLFRGVSFDTIAGSGPNGAIVHYRVERATDRALQPGSVFLLDSGGQYVDGTTDVTRTVWIAGGDGAPPPDELRDRFTRVLKGHIAVARAVFPRGVNGGQLDTLARAALWQAGLDYDHGTGHGVGAYLGVHEGPARISKVASSVPLAPGMILSNEPGYYKTGAYGIRIENLVIVAEQPAVPGGERPLLGFETITLVPIDRALVAPDMLTAEEAAWLDAYHARVLATHRAHLDAAAGDWLKRACEPIAQG